jgi:hypothetical protein
LKYEPRPHTDHISVHIYVGMLHEHQDVMNKD